jgi:deoxyribonuclease V
MAASRDRPVHRWRIEPTEALQVQLELAERVIADRPLGPYETVAGADVSYNKWSPTLYAAVVVLRADTLEVIDRAGVVAAATFPYIPGLLSFREAPPVIEAFEKLSVRPEVLICDGQGIAHPRRLGLASHLGLWLEIPTIGCAKSHLFGEYEEPGQSRGDWSPMTDGDRTVGAVLRTRDRVKPLFVSPGHLCDLPGAIAAVLAATRQYRQPVTTQMAHGYVNEMRLRGGP